jgi:hypothetical protein
VLPSENQGGNINIPSDHPSDSHWWDNLGPILVGLSIYKALRKMGGIGPTGRNVASVGAAGLYAGLVVTDKAIENSVGFNRFMVLISEVLSGKAITSIDQTYANAHVAKMNHSSIPTPIPTSPSPSVDPVDAVKVNQVRDLLEDMGFKGSNVIDNVNVDWTKINDLGHLALLLMLPKGSSSGLDASGLSDFAGAEIKNLTLLEQFSKDKLKVIFDNNAPASVLEEISKVSSSESSVSNNTYSSSLNSPSSSSPAIDPRGSTGNENLSITESKDIDKFLPDSESSSNLFLSLYERLYFSIISYLKPVFVQGYFDDLIGQRLFIEFILLMVSIFIFTLFLVFILNLIIYLNKDKIITLFPKNKFFHFILSIETILIKWTLILIPFFIFMGLFTLINAHIWLMTHPIPYDSLGIDLHQFISKK